MFEEVGKQEDSLSREKTSHTGGWISRISHPYTCRISRKDCSADNNGLTTSKDEVSIRRNSTVRLYVFKWNNSNAFSYTPTWLEMDWSIRISNKNIPHTIIPTIAVDMKTCGGVICVRSRPADGEMLSVISEKYTRLMIPTLKMLPRIRNWCKV